jgi:hypothetical protein
MLCKCGKACHIGKSMGSGIYSVKSESEQYKYITQWMWNHLFSCNEPDSGAGVEFNAGKLFDVVTEYDDRIVYGEDGNIETENKVFGR